MAETEVKLRALKNTESISEEVLSADSDSTSLVDESKKKACGRSRRIMASVSAEWDVKFANQQQELASMKQTLSSIENLLKWESDSAVWPSRQKRSRRVWHIVRNATCLTDTRVKVNGTRTKLFWTVVLVTMKIVCRYMTTYNLVFHQRMTIVKDPDCRQVALGCAVP